MKVLKFGAVWCNGCLVMKPRWQQIEDEYDWLKTEYYDYDQDKEMVEKFSVDQGKLPCFIFLDKNGREFLRLTGEQEKQDLIEIIRKNKDV